MNVTESIVIAASPEAVWRIGGDAGNVADWIPALEKSHLVGDIRHVTFAGGGGDATERIVEHDDAEMYYVYEYLTGPLPLSHYRSRLSVGEHADGAEVVWSADFGAGSPEEEAGLATAIAGIYRAGLEGLGSGRDPTMKVDIDLTRCQGHGRCYLLVPEVFEPGDDYGHARVHTAVDAGDAALRSKVGNAIKSCPEDALSWTKSVDRPEGA